MKWRKADEKRRFNRSGNFAEAIGMILGIVYIGLQIYYGIVYKVAPYKFICNIAGVVLIYVGLSLVSCQPEK